MINPAKCKFFSLLNKKLWKSSSSAFLPLFFFFFQVTKERVNLLSHPLVTYLLRYKWRSFGRYVYYGRLILYGIFLFFLTGYAMHTTKSIPIAECKEDQCACHVIFQKGTVGSSVLWRNIGRPVILTTTSISIFLEVRILSHLKMSILYFKLGGVLFCEFYLFIYLFLCYYFYYYYYYLINPVIFETA